jgi:hypothetical protein
LLTAVDVVAVGMWATRLRCPSCPEFRIRIYEVVGKAVSCRSIDSWHQV